MPDYGLAGWNRHDQYVASGKRGERTAPGVGAGRRKGRPLRRSGRPAVLSAANVLGARALRPLTRVERERLALTELVETPVDDGGLVEEVLVSVRRLDEPETLVADQALDDALHAGHVEYLPTTTKK